MRQLEGVYLLRTNVDGTDAGQAWEDYVTLVRVENAFRTLKQDLALRPVCHHLEERAEAHVLFCWIAYAMYWALERTLSSTGRIAERPSCIGGDAWHPNGYHLSAQGGWDETGTGASEYSPIRGSVGAAIAEYRAALTACSLDRLDLTLPEELGLFEVINDCSDKTSRSAQTQPDNTGIPFTMENGLAYPVFAHI